MQKDVLAHIIKASFRLEVYKTLLSMAPKSFDFFQTLPEFLVFASCQTVHTHVKPICRSVPANECKGSYDVTIGHPVCVATNKLLCLCKQTLRHYGRANKHCYSD